VKSRCVIHPKNYWKELWDIYVTMILLIVCCVTPYHLAFKLQDEEESFGVLFLNYFIDVSFLLDMIVIFHTAYYDSNFKLIISKKSIACQYIKTWFFIDLVSIFPIVAVAKLFGGNVSDYN
jgi:hyperpolarization activated cyclic nucleotide-gated potassium channel 2